MSETRIDFQGFHWIDLGNPKPDTLNSLAERYGLHPTSVQDCLEPAHLPKYEMIDEVGFIVLRAFDRDCSPEADTVQELTRKIAVFYSDRFVLTIHRQDQAFLTGLLEKWTKKSQGGDPVYTPEHVLSDLMNEVVRSYEKPVMECLASLDSFETEIFGAGTHRKFRMQKGYYLKRKVSVYKRMLRTTLEPLNKVMLNAESLLLPHFQNSKETVEGLYFYCDEISESIASLMNLHISLQSQKTNEASRRTNEVMRVLTIFSCFFLPINFIASIYGMNFEYMPETHYRYSYFGALAFMALVVLGIFLWFRRKGWLKKAAVSR